MSLIRHKEDDELLIEDVTRVHVERMSEESLYVGITGRNGQVHQLYLGAKTPMSWGMVMPPEKDSQ